MRACRRVSCGRGRGRGIKMGGGNSKEAQLEKYGQLLSSSERKALESTFHQIAGSPDVSAITEKQITVSSSH